MKSRRFPPYFHYSRRMKASQHALTRAPKDLDLGNGVTCFPSQNPNPIFRTTPNGAILYGNPACALLFTTWQCRIGETIPAAILDTVNELWVSDIQKTIDVDCQEKFYSITIIPDKHRGMVNYYGRDITDRIWIERDLEKREEQLHLALQTARQGLYHYDFRTRLIELSPVSKLVFGTKIDISHFTDEYSMLLHPADCERVKQSIQAFVENDSQIFYASFRLKNGDGGWICILTIGKVVERDVAGHPLRFMGTYTDITEHKRAEYILRESEERYRLLFENNNDANILSTREGDILAVNPETCRAFGYAQEELLRLNRADIIDNTSACLDKVFETLYRTKKYSGEMVFIRKDGTRFTAEVSIAIFEDRSGAFRHSVIIRDITERKKNEAALRLDEARLEALYALNRVNFADEAELAQLALDKAVELTGSEIGYFSFALGRSYWSSGLRGKCRESGWEHLSLDRGGVWADSDRLRRPVIYNDFQNINGRRGYPEGHPDLFRTMSVPVIMDGQMVLIAGVGNKQLPYDDTDVRQLQLFAERIWAMICRMRDETRLKKALAEKEVLLREAHHRVKNNLQAMIGLMNIQMRQIADPQSQRFLMELQQQARTMSLVYERLYQTENQSQVHMGDFLQQITANLLEAYGGTREVDLKVNCDPLFLSVDSATPCGLIVNELVTNALKHAFPPGFQGQKWIRVSLSAKDRPVVLEIEDNGVGFSLDADQKKMDSTGLQLVNLWVTHQLGGRIEIYSQPGMRFVFTFPNL